jgi:TolB protein
MPNGEQFVFNSNADDKPGIYVVNADGSNSRYLTTTRTFGSPVWSPDGGQIAFIAFRDGNFEINVMQADGSSVRRLTEGPNDGNPIWLR